ncbi:CHAT domain-containing protein [Streptomyces sp. NPDC047860]|uniref:CHAT domain-containing protein n=1 Tax=Streptomyces sp. NPDC047860 TaxID=3155743 RepID=UPI0033D6E9EF
MVISKEDAGRLMASAQNLKESGSPEECAAVAKACNRAMDAGAPLAITQRTSELLAACRSRLPADHPLQADLFGLESEAWHHRYRRTGQDGDLRQAIELIDKACDLITPSHSSFHRLRNQQAFTRSLVRNSGEDVLAVMREAVEAGDPDPHNYAIKMINLAMQLQLRYQERRAGRDLTEAIDLVERALALDTRTYDDEHPWRLLWAGQLYLQKGHDTKDGPLLERAVEVLQKAVLHLPPGHTHLPGMLNQLGGAMHAHAVLSDSPETRRSGLAAAVQTLKASVQLLDPTVPDFPTFTCNLVTALRNLSEVTGDPTLVDEAIAVAERGIIAGEANPTARDVDRLKVLMGVLRSRHERDDAAAAIQLLSTSFEGTHRIEAVLAGQIGSGLAARTGDWETALQLILRAVEVLPHAASEALSLEDREKGLATIATDLARDACALMLRTNRSADEALQVLENARATLIGQVLSRRSDADLDPVRARAPRLAERMQELRLELARVKDASYGPAADHRHRLTDAVDEVTRQIRAVPGLESYLRSPAPDVFRRWAGDMPLVTLNVSNYRCDAIVLRAGEATRVVPLPGLVLHDAAEQAVRFTVAMRELTRKSAPGPLEANKHRRTAEDVLAWLWEAAVDPVFSALGFTSAVQEGALPPRLRWLSTGPLTLLPLHAAGLPNVPGASAADRVVSSYTPTLRLLDDAGASPTGTERHRDGHLVVPVPRSSLMPYEPLKGAEEEADYVVSTVPGALPLPTESVSALAVKAGLAGARSVHFSCHGQSDAKHPSRSHLILRDEALTVADLMVQRLHGLQLAVLSACSTADAGEQLPDEVLHLTSAFRAAGARHVVGTLWKTGDVSAAEFTRAFYSALGPLVRTSAQDASGDSVAFAVHKAVRHLRARNSSPKVWAPFVHVG